MCNYDFCKMTSQGPNRHNLLQVVPCIIASRADSDLTSTFEDASLDRSSTHENVIIVVFGPKAPFMPEKLVSYFEKYGDEFMVKDMVDVVFFDDELYSCHTNDEAVVKMKKILRWDKKNTKYAGRMISSC